MYKLENYESFLSDIYSYSLSFSLFLLTDFKQIFLFSLINSYDPNKL